MNLFETKYQNAYLALHKASVFADYAEQGLISDREAVHKIQILFNSFSDNEKLIEDKYSDVYAKEQSLDHYF